MNNRLEFGRQTETQKDTLEPVCPSLTSCTLDDVADVQSMLVLFIITPGPGVTEVEGGNIASAGRAAVPRTTG